MEEYVERLRLYFQGHPDKYGLILLAMGFLWLTGTIRRWNWIMEIKVTWVGRMLYEKYGDRYVLFRLYFISFALIITGIIWYFLF